MSKLKQLTLTALFLTLSWTAQSQDSLQTIEIQRWKVLQLLDIAKTAASCDSLQRYQEREINAGIRLQDASDSLLSLTTYQLVLAKADAGMANQQIENQKALTRDQARKKRRAWLVAGAILAVWVTVEVLTE